MLLASLRQQKLEEDKKSIQKVNDWLSKCVITDEINEAQSSSIPKGRCNCTNLWCSKSQTAGHQLTEKITSQLLIYTIYNPNIFTSYMRRMITHLKGMVSRWTKNYKNQQYVKQNKLQKDFPKFLYLLKSMILMLIVRGSLWLQVGRVLKRFLYGKWALWNAYVCPTWFHGNLEHEQGADAKIDKRDGNLKIVSFSKVRNS